MNRAILAAALLLVVGCEADPVYPWYYTADADASDGSDGGTDPDTTLDTGVDTRVDPDADPDVDTGRPDTSADADACEGAGCGDVCVSASPTTLEFGTSEVFEATVRSVLLTPCGADPVTILDVEIAGATSFYYDGPGLPMSVGSDSWIQFGFAPVAAGAQTATVTFVVDGADDLVVTLRGTGWDPESACPVAVMGCREAGSGDAFDGTLSVPVGTEVECSGGGSFGDLEVVDWFWDLVTRPLGSSSALETFEDMAVWVPDSPGNYYLELEVADTDGTLSCEPASAEVHATSEPVGDMPSMVLQLDWDTAADLDNHLLRGAAALFSLTGDCHYGARSPEWGLPGSADNPSLDRDDTDGFGPERITILSVEPGVTYTSVVVVSNPGTAGPTTATLSLRIGDVTYGEWDREVTLDNQEWTVFEVTFDTFGDYDVAVIDSLEVGAGP